MRHPRERVKEIKEMNKLVQQAIDEATDDAKYFNIQASDEPLKATFERVQKRFPKMTYEMFIMNQAKTGFNNSRISQVKGMNKEISDAYLNTFIEEIVAFDSKKWS